MTAQRLDRRQVLPGATLPALTDLADGGIRASSAIDYELLHAPPLLQSQGSCSYSPGASPDTPGNLELSGPPGQAFAWAVYSLSGIEVLFQRYVESVNVEADNEYLLAVANFETGKWEILPSSSNGSFQLSAGASLVSTAGNFYVAVICPDSQSILSSLRLTTNQLPPQPPLFELWFVEYADLSTVGELAAAIEHLNSAALAGYQKVVLFDTELERLDLASPAYLASLQQYKQAAQSAGIELIPNVVSPSDATPLLARDPSLIEGQLVKAADFMVDNGVADVVQDPGVAIANGDFEQHDGDGFESWDDYGSASVSADIGRGGDGLSACFDLSGSGNVILEQDFPVKPAQCYVISFWARSEGMPQRATLRQEERWTHGRRSSVATVSGHVVDWVYDPLSYNNAQPEADQDWTQYHLVVNSGDFDLLRLTLGLGSTAERYGRLWIDDLTVENAGLLNLIRRESAPLLVTDEGGFTVYQEGVDFEPVEDPLLGQAGGEPGHYDLYHPRPKIKILAGGGITEGQKLKLSYRHATTIGSQTPCCTLQDQGLYDIIDSVLAKVKTELNPASIFVSPHEHLVAGWSEPGYSLDESGGDALAGFAAQFDALAAGIDPAWRVVCFSDMFNEGNGGNSYSPYAFCYRGAADAVAGLPTDWDMFSSETVGFSGDNLDFLAQYGNRQIIRAFEDDKYHAEHLKLRLDHVRQAGLSGVFAVAYYTHRDDYSDLVAMAQVVQDWSTYNP
jgi:hypothetical protein